LCTVQRINATVRSPPYIICDEKTVAGKINTTLENTTDSSEDEDEPVIFSLSYDATKTPKVLNLSSTHNAILGGAYPDHYIPIDNMDGDTVNAKLAPDSNIVRANEVKVPNY
jgi:hypothetical protein